MNSNNKVTQEISIKIGQSKRLWNWSNLAQAVLKNITPGTVRWPLRTELDDKLHLFGDLAEDELSEKFGYEEPITGPEM